MSINYTIPRSSIYNSTRNIFEARFNIPEIGKYSFNTLQNTSQNIIEMKKNAVYLIERISIGGDIPEENYFAAQEINPEIVLRRSISGERIYPRPLPVLNYCDGAEIVAWVVSNKLSDFLTISMSGILRQTAELCGITVIKISVSLSIYEILSTKFFSRFSGAEGADVGKQVSGGDLPKINCTDCYC